MRTTRPLCIVALLLAGALWSAPGQAQDLALTADCEDGFQRFIHMAEQGQLGADVSEANVGVFKTWARVELVRRGAPTKVLLLTPKATPQVASRYFDIAPGDGADAADVRRVGRALDEVFTSDPFHLPGLEEVVPGSPIAGVTDAWRYGGWRGVLRVLEQRMMVLVSLQYTVAVIAALMVGSLLSLLLLWGSDAARPPAPPAGRAFRSVLVPRSGSSAAPPRG
jgi:hypothetical protein